MSPVDQNEFDALARRLRATALTRRSATMIRWMASLVALSPFAAAAADLSGEWTATIVSAAGRKDYTYVFRQNGADVIGTVRSQDALAAISDGTVNYKTITFSENVTVDGRRIVLEYTGELVSDNEIRFKRQAAGTQYPVVQFVATRRGTAKEPVSK
jgi:hypothetical protein